MIALLIKSSIVIAVLLAFYKLFLEKESFFKNNRIYLFGGLLIAFILPFITLPQMVNEQGIVSEMIEKMSNEEKSEEVFVDTQIPELTEDNTRQISPLVENDKAEISSPTTATLPIENTAKTAISTDINITETSYSLSDWLLFAYGFGVIIFTLHLLTQIISLVFKIVKIEDKIEDEGAIIVNMTNAKEPFSFFKYIFINPKSYDYETYEQILTHEKIHVQQRHTLDLLLSEIATIILWFNPLVWLFRKEVEKNIEYQTDDLLLKENADEKEFYQMNLVRIATYNRPLTVTTNYNQSLIKQRLLKMNSQKSTPHSYWKYAFILPMIFGILLILNKPITAFAQPAELTDIETIDTAPLEKTEAVIENAIEIPKEKTKPQSSENLTITPEIVIGNQVCEGLKTAARSRNSKEVYNILKTENLACLIEDGSSPTEVELIKEAAILQVALMNIDYSGNFSYEIDAMQISWEKLPKEEELNCIKLYEAARDGDLEEVREILETEDLTCLTMRDGSTSVYTNVIKNVVRLGGKVEIGDNYEVIISGLKMNFIFDEEDSNSATFSDDTQYQKRSNNNDSECCQLINAITNNEFSKVKNLVTESNLNCICKSDYIEENGERTSYIRNFLTPLTASARQGNLEITKFLLDKGADVNFMDRGLPLPLLSATEGGNLDIVKLFLKKGANINYLTEGHGNALMSAARSGQTEIIDFLLKEGVDINTMNNGQGSALMCAARSGHTEAIDLLLKNGADINAMNNGQGSALMCAARHGKSDVMEILLKNGADINAMNNGQGTALMCAVRHGHIETINFLLKNGADINALNNGQGNAIMCAARHGHLDIIKLLLKNGADINAINDGQGNALMCTARHGHNDIAEFLIKEGIDVNAVNNGQGSALMCAARHGHNSMIELLLKNGAKVNTISQGQGTALICAVRHDNFSTAKLLLENGADAKINTNGHGSALSNAHRKNYKRMIDLLEQEQGAQ